MATDVNDLSGMTGDWKVKVIVGVVLFIVGIIGLADLIPIGWGMPERWTTSTLLVIVGLSVVMYGLADIT